MPQDFRMASDRASLKRLLDYLDQDFPQVFPRQHVQRLLSQLEAQKSAERLEEDEEDRGRYLGRVEEVSLLSSTRKFCRSLDPEVELNTVVEY